MLGGGYANVSVPAGLVPIKAYVTVDEKVTNPNLLNCIGTFRPVT